MIKHAVVIGAGFGGMSAAAYLAKAGYKVTVLEKNAAAGGRAAVLKQDGFTWDLGPSWYMMPDVFEEFFADFDKKVSDYYELQRLDPAYRVFDSEKSPIDVGRREQTVQAFEAVRKGDGKGLETLLEQTSREYDEARRHVLNMDWLSPKQMLDSDILGQLARPSLLGSYHGRIARHIKDERLRRVLEFMAVFLGGSPQNVPGIYAVLAHADMDRGIWYPTGGFRAVTEAFESLCKSLGVEFRYNTEVARIITSAGRVKGVRPLHGEPLSCEVVVANADYQHVQTQLLSAEAQDMPERKWRRKTLSPSGLIISLGVKKKLPNLLHHNLFFDADWKGNFEGVFRGEWSEKPLFYLGVPSKSDSHVAPKKAENLFILAPEPGGEQPSQAVIDRTVNNIITRIEKKTGERFIEDIVAMDVRAQDYFQAAFNAYRGNAFGLAHTFFQSAMFRPRLKSKKVGGLYFAGQYTNPGTGVPMVVLSGKIAAKLVSQQE